jgi:1-acyl-sn-glycerol-3-phosphate acyltransferase
MSNGQEDASSPLPPDALAANSRFMNALRTAVYWGITRWLAWYFHFKVEGAEVFRRTPQFVLISNHSSHLDAVCLLAALPTPLRNRCFSAAASDYFYTNPIRKWAARLLANTFPFTRHTDPQGGLDACARILARGDSLIFFPEGTRSVTGELQPFKKGIGALVQGTPYPVIPAYLHGTHRVLGKGRMAPRLARLRVTFGSPQVFSAVPTGEESAERIAERLHDLVAALKETDAPAGKKP